MGTQGSPVKSYDYLLKFLLVGDSDVGKGEILESLQDGASESPYAYSNGIDYKTTTILLDGRRVKLELWDTSGQGRFCTIFRSYSRGAQHAPGVPRILVGNRLHLAFKRQVPTEQARSYAEKNCMTFFEVSPLCNFNVIESFTEFSSGWPEDGNAQFLCRIRIACLAQKHPIFLKAAVFSPTLSCEACGPKYALKSGELVGAAPGEGLPGLLLTCRSRNMDSQEEEEGKE
ncbi:Ras-related protein Rab-40C, partial [Ophiophagus hannah]